MKHYLIRVTDSKATFTEELMANLGFIDYKEIKSQDEASELYASASKKSVRSATKKLKNEREQNIVQLREAIKSIDEHRK